MTLLPAAGPGAALAVARRPDRRENLKRLLKPRHVAVIGGREAAIVIQQCRSVGFTGEIWPVNAAREVMEGLSCYAAIGDLPAAPDAAFIAVPREATVEAVRALAARGAGGCVCYAAGFAEVGGEGAGLQARLAEAAGDMALVGPNCYGVLNYLDGAALWPEQHGGGRVERGVAIVTQSGNIGLNLTMQERSLPIAYVISIGNQACLGFADYVAALAEDQRVSAIGFYIEGLTDVAAFSRAAATALQNGVPLVALKAGTSAAGARMTLSHTSSLSGTAEMYGALFARLGIAQVGSLNDLVETLKLFAVMRPPAGRRLAVMSSSGGEATLVADLASARGFSLPALSEAQARELKGLLRDFTTVSNPLDYNTGIWGDPAAMERCFATVMAGDFDLALLIIDFPRDGVPGAEAWHVALDAFIAAHKRSRMPAAVMSTLTELMPRTARDRLIGNGIVPLQGLEETVNALDAAARIGGGRRRLEGGGADCPLALPEAAPLPENPTTLDEWDSKKRLAGFGLPVPEGRRVAADAAPKAAAELGFPVAVKALGIAHKTEAGALALDLRTAEEVCAAVARVQESDAQAGARVLVERMVTGAVAELIVGVKADPQFGLALVLGSGGVLVELVGDSRTLLLPTDRAAVSEALDSLKAARLLAGYRGRPKGDRAAAIEAIMAVAAFAEAHRGRLAELDVNPLLVLPKGAAGGAVAADALIRMTEE